MNAFVACPSLLASTGRRGLSQAQAEAWAKPRTRTRTSTDAAPCRCTPNMDIIGVLRTGVSVLSAAVALTITSPSRPNDVAVSIPPAIALTANTTTISTNEATDANVAQKGAPVYVAAGRSIHDLTPDYDSPVPAASGLIAAADEGEFALSVRLLTACALGMLAGTETGAVALGLGIRGLMATSLSACLASIYMLLPAGAETASIARVVPPSCTALAAVAVSLTACIIYATLQQHRPLLRRRRLLRSAMAAAVVSAAAGAGAACAAGQALPAALLYLFAIGVCRSVPIPVTRRTRLQRSSSLSPPPSPQPNTAKLVARSDREF